MPDSFAIDLQWETTDVNALWAVSAAAEKAVRDADRPRKAQASEGWRLSTFDGRTWQRKALAETRALVSDLNPENYKVGWMYSGVILGWWQDHTRWSDGRVIIRVRAFGGEERLQTEAVAGQVARVLQEQGYPLTVGDTQLSSVDDGRRSPSATVARDTLGSRLKTSFAEHTGRYVVGVATGLTVAVLAAVLGLSR